MADDQYSALDSPWVQLGVPLAATLATAIAPRHAGRVSALGLNAFHGINQYRFGQQRLSQIQSKIDAENNDEADFGQEFDALAEGGDPSPAPVAPEGGDAPRATEAARTQTLESGSTPKQTARLSAITRQAGSVLKGSKYGRQILKKMMEDDLSQSQKDARGSTLQDAITAGQGANLPPGASISGVPLVGGGQFALNPPEKKAPHFVGGHRGDKQIEFAIDQDNPSNVQEIPLGEHTEPNAPQPKFVSFKEGDKVIGSFVTPEGRVSRFVLGDSTKSPQAMAANLKNKAALASAGQKTGDAQFDQAFSGPDGQKRADDLFKKLSTPNIMDQMIAAGLFGGAGGAGVEQIQPNQ